MKCLWSKPIGFLQLLHSFHPASLPESAPIAGAGCSGGRLQLQRWRGLLTAPLKIPLLQAKWQAQYGMAKWLPAVLFLVAACGGRTPLRDELTPAETNPQLESTGSLTLPNGDTLAVPEGWTFERVSGIDSAGGVLFDEADRVIFELECCGLVEARIGETNGQTGHAVNVDFHYADQDDDSWGLIATFLEGGATNLLFSPQVDVATALAIAETYTHVEMGDFGPDDPGSNNSGSNSGGNGRR